MYLPSADTIREVMMLQKCPNNSTGCIGALLLLVVASADQAFVRSTSVAWLNSRIHTLNWYHHNIQLDYVCSEQSEEQYA